MPPWRGREVSDVQIFEAGAIFGVCMSVVLLIAFMRVFGQEDD